MKISEEVKKEVVHEHLNNGRTIRGLAAEYGVSASAINTWVKKYREECQNSPQGKTQLELMEENRRLRKEKEELEKENAFLKKAAAFFAKETV